MKKPCRVLCLFDYAANTGFATVSKNVMKHLKSMFGPDVRFDICAINYFGDMYQESENVFVFSAIKSATKKDEFGRFGFMKVLQDSDEYDGIFILQDLGVIVPVISILKTIKEKKKEAKQKLFKSIFYFPVDCRLVPELVRDIEFFDKLVTYNDWSRKEVLRLRPELLGKISAIPHGVDINQFRPLAKDEKHSFRKEYFKDNADKFIVLNLNRNQPRKDIPTTIFSFIEFKKKFPDAFLYLHMNPEDPMGWNLRGVLSQTNLKEGTDYMFPPKDIENHGAGIDLVNKIYNACDVFVSTTLGEGWGLSISESQATCIPVVVPLHTSFFEITNNGKRVYAVETLYPCCNSVDNVIRQQCDYVEVAETIEEVYHAIKAPENSAEKQKLKTKIEASYNYAKSLHWRGIARQWADIMKQTF